MKNAGRLGLKLVFEATSARTHILNAPLYRDAGLTAIDLTPAEIGPAVVPTVNMRDNIGQPNVNLITCGGQATIPIVAAVTRICRVPYAEIVSTVASRSAGPGTRANIDEFTEATARGLEAIGGADHGKAIIILNPAEPPIIMRNTIYCALADDPDFDAISDSIATAVNEVASYVAGYRLKGIDVDEGPFETPG